jgi:glutaconate CoA-transferase subunit A
MLIIRELIRQNQQEREIKNLTLIGGFSLGIQIDMLVGAGLVGTVICPYIGFESFYGLGPNFRRAIENNEIKNIEIEEGGSLYGLQAAAKGLPFHPFPGNVIEGTDFPKISPEIYKQIISPFDNSTYYVVPPLKPDIAILHSQYSDVFGNSIYLGAGSIDSTMAEAADRVILTCDEIVPLDWVRQEYVRTHIIGHFVTELIQEWFPTHPCSSHGMYHHDEAFINLYLRHARAGQQSFQEFLEKYVIQPKTHRSYLRLIGGKALITKLKISGGI